MRSTGTVKGSFLGSAFVGHTLAPVVSACIKCGRLLSPTAKFRSNVRIQPDSLAHRLRLEGEREQVATGAALSRMRPIWRCGCP